MVIDKMDRIRLKDGDLINLIKEIPVGTIFPLVCSGKSMQPTFLDDKTIVYLSIGIPKRICERDILLFYRKNNKAVLHRVKSICYIDKRKSEMMLTMNGDAQLWTENISKEQILGKVVGFQRYGKSDKYIDVQGRKFKLYSCIWSHLFSVRYYLLKIVQFGR